MDYKAIAKQIIELGVFAGVRSLTDDEQYQVGDYCRESYEWDYDVDSSMYDLHGEDGLTVGGTCATRVDRDLMSEYKDDWKDDAYLTSVANAIESAVKYNKAYVSDRQVIIIGDDVNSNVEADDNEIRIVDAKVLAFVC